MLRSNDKKAVPVGSYLLVVGVVVERYPGRREMCNLNHVFLLAAGGQLPSNSREDLPLELTHPSTLPLTPGAE